MISEMHFEAVIDGVWRCTGRPRWSQLRDALGGYDRARLEEYLEVIDLEAVNRKGGTPQTEAIFRGQLEIVRMSG